MAESSLPQCPSPNRGLSAPFGPGQLCERGCPCLSMEAYGSGHNEYAAGQHLVRQAIDLLQARPQGDFPELLPAV